MHQGVVGLLAGVEQEVERPSVLSPLDRCERQKRREAARQKLTVLETCTIKQTHLSALERFPLDAGAENRGEFVK